MTHSNADFHTLADTAKALARYTCTPRPNEVMKIQRGDHTCFSAALWDTRVLARSESPWQPLPKQIEPGLVGAPPSRPCVVAEVRSL